MEKINLGNYRVLSNDISVFIGVVYYNIASRMYKKISYTNGFILDIIKEKRRRL